jgi:GNAT superfamily N-acetyltransferase
MRIELLTEFSTSFLEGLDAGLRAHESKISTGNFVGVAAWDQQTLVGGVSVWAFLDSFDIRQMWVSEAFRGRGIGSEVLSIAEEEAIKVGCRLALVETWSFQAPGFYRRSGYTEFARIDKLGLPAKCRGFG